MTFYNKNDNLHLFLYNQLLKFAHMMYYNYNHIYSFELSKICIISEYFKNGFTV